MNPDHRRYLWLALPLLTVAAVPFSVPSGILFLATERIATMWVAASAGVAVLAGCIGLGLLVTPRSLLRDDWHLAVLMALAAGTGLMSCAVLAIGLVSEITRIVGWLLLLVSITGGALRLLRVFRCSNGCSNIGAGQASTPASPLSLIAFPLLLVGCALLVVTTFAPPLLFDVTEYHLGAFCDNLLQARASSPALHFQPVLHNFYARFPFPIESLYWLGLVLAPPLDFAPKVVNSGFIVACAWLVARMLRGAGVSTELRCLAAAALLAHPVMRDVSLDAFIDAPSAFLVAVAVYAACVLPLQQLPLAIFIFGCALASKYTVAQVYLLPFIALLLFARGREMRTAWPASLRVAGLGIVALVIVPFFWLGKNVIFYGNPLEPFFNWLFRPADSAAIARENFYIASHYPQPFWGLGYWTSLAPRLREFGWLFLPLAALAPLNVQSESSRNSRSSRRLETALLLFISASYLLWNLVRESQNRFLLPAILVILYLAFVTLDRLPGKPTRGLVFAAVAVWVALQLVLQAFILSNGGEFHYLANFAVADTRQSATAPNEPSPRDEFYKQNLGALGELLPAANALPAGSRLLLVYEARPFLFTHLVAYNTVWDNSELLRIAGDATTSAVVAQRLHAAGITHVLVNRQELRRYIQQYILPEQLHALGVGPHEDYAAAFYATPTPEELFPPFYRDAKWKSSRAAILDFLTGLRARAIADKGTAPLEIYLSPVP